MATISQPAQAAITALSTLIRPSAQVSGSGVSVMPTAARRSACSVLARNAISVSCSQATSRRPGHRQHERGADVDDDTGSVDNYDPRPAPGEPVRFRMSSWSAATAAPLLRPLCSSQRVTPSKSRNRHRATHGPRPPAGTSIYCRGYPWAVVVAPSIAPSPRVLRGVPWDLIVLAHRVPDDTSF
jgi:hypothetical protein